MKGRKPAPDNIIALKGGPRHYHKKPGRGGPKPPSVIPKCPKHLDKEARAEWRRMGAELHKLGLLAEIDKGVFALYCESYSAWAQESILIQTEGTIIMTPDIKTTKKDGTVTEKKGHPITNPRLILANQAKDRMLKALVEMGMSPSSRARVKITPQEEKKDETKDKGRFFEKK